MIIEIIIVAVIVLTASVIAGRRLYRTFARGNACPGCSGNCSNCGYAPLKTDKDASQNPD